MNEEDLLREYGLDSETKRLERQDRVLGRIQMLVLAAFVIGGVVWGLHVSALDRVVWQNDPTYRLLRRPIAGALVRYVLAFTAVGVVVLKLTQPILRAFFQRKNSSVEREDAARDFPLF